MDLTIGTFPQIRDARLRADLISEEASETVAALNKNELLETIDGLCDLLYVAYGTAVTLGVDLEPFFDEVHRSNMAKVGGPVRADGKRLKPAGWLPPNLASILALQAGRKDDHPTS